MTAFLAVLTTVQQAVTAARFLSALVAAVVDLEKQIAMIATYVPWIAGKVYDSLLQRWFGIPFVSC